jgi:hypothetical protein
MGRLLRDRTRSSPNHPPDRGRTRSSPNHPPSVPYLKQLVTVSLGQTSSERWSSERLLLERGSSERVSLEHTWERLLTEALELLLSEASALT